MERRGGGWLVIISASCSPLSLPPPPPPRTTEIPRADEMPPPPPLGGGDMALPPLVFGFCFPSLVIIICLSSPPFSLPGVDGIQMKATFVSLFLSISRGLEVPSERVHTGALQTYSNKGKGENFFLETRSPSPRKFSRQVIPPISFGHLPIFEATPPVQLSH